MDHSKKPQTAAVVTHPNRQLLPSQNRYVVANRYGLENLEEDDSDGGLLAYWRILVRHKKSIILSSFAGLLIGFAVGIPMKPLYRAQTSIEVLTLNEDFMNMKQASPTTTNDGNYDTSEEQTQAKLLASSALLNRVIAKLDPTGAPVHTRPKAARSGWRSLLHLPEPVLASPRQLLISKALKSLKIRPAARTRVLDITVESTDSQLATEFANTLTQEFIAQNMEARWAITQRTSEWLRRELDDARSKLRKSEDSLQDYARVSGLIFTDETTNVSTEKLQQLQQSLSSATSDRIAKQSRYELAQNAPPASLADVLNDSSLRETQSKINDLARQIADVSAVYSAEYSKVRRLQAELEVLKPAFEQQRNDILARIKNDYTEAERREKLLESAYKTQAQNVTGQDEKAIQYNILKRDVDSNRQLYDTMLQQMKQASIASAMRASNVRVVDQAEVSDVPVSPNFQLNSGLGLLTGLILSIVVVAVKERADRTLQQPGDIKLWTDMPELGIIPSASLDTRKLAYSHTMNSLEATKSIFSGLKKSAATEPVELITREKAPSLVAEAFRSALTSILFVSENEDRPKVLVFTSANAADGKTTVVSNIALAAAEIGLRVLVIDADLRRPRMHLLFDLDNRHGLTGLLQGASLEIDLSNFVKSTNVDGLHVITAGPATQAAAHLLYSPRFAAILSRLRGEYDMIMIDTPPMMQMTDARVAGRLADAVILVARSNRTTRDSILAAKERFAEDRIHVMGAVLNDWSPTRSKNGDYQYRYSGSYYNKN